MDRISKQTLVAQVAESAGTSKALAEGVIDATLSAITSAVTAGTAVHLGNTFGTFQLRQVKATTKFNLATKQPIAVPAKQVIKFSPSASLKSAVNK
jgi:DNA-binding protein HU-beta